MKGVLIRFLIVGVPGFCFVIVGALNAEYPGVALGGVLVIDAIYGLTRKRGAVLGKSDRKQQPRSFVLAGIIGASCAVTGFMSHQYWLGAIGTVIFIGALLRLYGGTFANRL